MKRIEMCLCGIVMGLVLFTSCTEHKKIEKSEPKSRFETDLVKPESLEQKTYKTVRIYAGTIPCADCSGIEQRLVLKGDTAGVYRLSEVYKNATEDGDAHLVSTGEWKIGQSKKTKDKILVLSQGHMGDSTRVARYKFSDKKLVQTSLDEDTIKTSWSYILKRKGN